jgi:hypothetical protein
MRRLALSRLSISAKRIGGVKIIANVKPFGGVAKPAFRALSMLAQV